MKPRNVSHGWQGGSIAVYASDSLYKVEAVTGIVFPRRSSEDGGGSRQSDTERKGSGFARILEIECDKAEEPKDIRVQTTGYTRLGMPTAFFMNMREYTYNK